MGQAEPERELVGRIAPLALPAAVLAYVAGAVVAGPGAGWSAAVAVAVVTANFAAAAWAASWAASISATVLSGVVLFGFIVRLGLVALLIAGLVQLPWFSLTAFLAALVPATIAVLVLEMKVLSGRMQADLWTLPGSPGARR
jgi:hypothetical protein